MMLIWILYLISYVLLFYLTFQSLPVTSRTTKFNIKKSYIVITQNLCGLYGSQNKQQILTYTAFKDWYL